MQKDDLQDKFVDEIDLPSLLRVLWLNKIFISTITGIFTLISVLYSLFLTNVYTSQALLVPTSLSSTNIESNVGINLFAGLSASQSSPDVTIAIAFIQSKKIIRQLMKHETFLPDLMAAKKWHMQSNSIIYNKDIYDEKNKKWVRNVSLPLQSIPSEQEAYKFFSRQINISRDQKNRLIVLSVKHISPSVAQQWAEWIIDEANLMVANLRIEQAESSIDYLNNQIKLTPYAELRTLFFNLIQQSTQNIMLAKVNKYYALTIIDQPLIPENKSEPNRRVVCILGTLLGGILSSLIIIIRKYGFGKEDKLVLYQRI